MDNKAFFKLNYGLYIITSCNNEKAGGCIANTFTQVTSQPSQICVTLNKDNYTTQLINDSGVFNCGVLLKEVPMDTIRRFGFQSGKDVDKIDGIDYFVDSQGVKQINQSLAATFECKVTKTLDVGTHIMFVAEVVDAKVLSDEDVLTYSDYHLLKKGTTPKNAPSFIQETTKRGWRCDVCGYIYEGEDLPADYISPVCKVDRTHFKEI